MSETGRVYGNLLALEWPAQRSFLVAYLHTSDLDLVNRVRGRLVTWAILETINDDDRRKVGPGVLGGRAVVRSGRERGSGAYARRFVFCRYSRLSLCSRR